MNCSMSRESTSSSRLEQCRQTSICLVLLVGIPGSGKSHFRKLLENYFRNTSKTVLGSFKVFSVSYDEFNKVRNPTQFIDGVNWKEERLEILKAIEDIIKNIRNCTHVESCVGFEKLCVINSEIKNPDVVLFIIDDNMYYRSMRYEYYKLSKTYSLGFCQIFFDATKEDALKYNKQRGTESQVPDFVIEKMFEKLEPPDKTFSWEKNMLSLTPYKEFEKDGVLESILSLIEVALKCPVQQYSQILCREESQRINNSNFIHQIDIQLKKLIGGLIKRKIMESNDNPSMISKYFSEQRLIILRKIKYGKIVLPVDLSEHQHISTEDIELIKPILSDLLESTADS